MNELYYEYCVQITEHSGEKKKIDLYAESDIKARDLSKRVKKQYNAKSVKVLGYYKKSFKYRCKYCGELTSGIDTDVLCSECISVFGHTLYSEL